MKNVVFLVLFNFKKYYLLFFKLEVIYVNMWLSGFDIFLFYRLLLIILRVVV